MKKFIILLLALFIIGSAYQCKEALDKVKGKAMQELKAQAMKKCKGSKNVKKCIEDFLKAAK